MALHTGHQWYMQDMDHTEFTKHILYLTLTGEQGYVCCFIEKGLCYCGTSSCPVYLPRWNSHTLLLAHYSDVIMGAMASQITSLTIVYSTVYSGADQRKYQSSTSLAFVRGIHWWTANSQHKWPVSRIMFPFDDVIMSQETRNMIKVNAVR